MLNSDTKEDLLPLKNGPEPSWVEGYSLEFHALRSQALRLQVIEFRGYSWSHCCQTNMKHGHAPAQTASLKEA